MAKNIAVIDEQGNRYGATYPKRAKGLVKKGRARFVDEETICLARPPDKSEDDNMSKKMTDQNTDTGNLNPESLEAESLNPERVSLLKEQLETDAAACLEAIRQRSGEGQETPQGNAMSSELVKRVLDQLRFFSTMSNDAEALAELNLDDSQTAKVLVSSETTKQRQIELYRAILDKAWEDEARAFENRSKGTEGAIEQLERLTAWMNGLNRNNFSSEQWKMIVTRVHDMQDAIMANAIQG